MPATSERAPPQTSVTAGAALRPVTWRFATVVDVVSETARAKTLLFDVPGWPGHRAGQHVDVRLTAEDGYRAERSFSIASPPEVPGLELTVERLDGGEGPQAHEFLAVQRNHVVFVVPLEPSAAVARPDISA